MKTFVYDLNNLGILFVSESKSPRLLWNLHILKACILDIEIGKIYENSPVYKELTNSSITQDFYAVAPHGVIKGSNLEVNSIFTAKLSKLKLIMPLIELLSDVIYKRSISQIYPFAVSIDDTLCFEVLNSNPTTNCFTPGILEYAKTLEITPYQAYQELKLEYETIHSIKLKSYAMTKKYQSLIRNVETQEQATQLHSEMHQRLFKDTFI